MNNKEVCDYVQTIDEKTYISELCVSEGFGQSCGGYLKSKNKVLSEKEHFLYFYGNKNKAERFPSYNRLRCPQLLLFVAEFAGVSKERLEKAYEKLKLYEQRNCLQHSKEKKWKLPISKLMFKNNILRL